MTKSHAVLIVDDEPDVLFSLTGLLRRDFQVYTATSGQDALEIMRQHPVHVIMTDQRMPAMTGAELMENVRLTYPDAVRIIFTGYADTRAVVDAINSGELYRYITKPWDPDDLIEVLKDAAQRYDAMAAQAEILDRLPDYLDRCDQVAAAGDGAQVAADVRDAFAADTQKLRELYQRTGVTNDE